MFVHWLEKPSLKWLRTQHTPKAVRRAASLASQAGGGISRDDVLRIQRKRFRRVAAYAVKRSDFYRDHFADTDLDLHDHAGLASVPTLSSSDLREQGNAIRCVPEAKVAATFASSGTTGEPKRLDFDFGDVQAVANSGALVVRTALPGRLVCAVAMPLEHGLWVGWRQVCWIIERAGGNALTLGASDPESVADGIRRYQPNMLATSPSFAMLLIDELKRDHDRVPMERVILGAEKADDEQRQMITEFFSCPPISAYSSTELGVGQAASLPGATELFFNELDVLAEIVDDEGRPITDAETEGELAFTTLTRRCMPLIRYRSGDRAQWLEDADAADHDDSTDLVVGQLPFRRFQVLGRTDETLILAGSNISATVLADLLRDGAEDACKVEITVDGEKPRQLTLRVEADIDVEKVRRRVLDKYPRLGDHLETGSLKLKIEPKADLSDQLKPLAVKGA